MKCLFFCFQFDIPIFAEAIDNAILSTLNFSRYKVLRVAVIPGMDYASTFLENLTLFELKHFSHSVEPVTLKLKDSPILKVASQIWNLVE